MLNKSKTHPQNVSANYFSLDMILRYEPLA